MRENNCKCACLVHVSIKGKFREAADYCSNGTLGIYARLVKKRFTTSVNISYSVIDSSSIINIDLTSQRRPELRLLSLLIPVGLYFRKAIWKIAVIGNGNNLLRMEGQINKFFSSCASTAIGCFLFDNFPFSHESANITRFALLNKFHPYLSALLD